MIDRIAELAARDSELQHLSLEVPTFQQAVATLRGKICANLWHDEAINPRRVYRPSYVKMYGKGGDLPMPLAASWMSTGPDADADNRNVIAFPHLADPTFLSYMRDIGVLGDYRLADFQDLPNLARALQMPIYNVDELPEEWDPLSANSARTMRIINTKKYLDDITSFGAPSRMVDMRATTREDYELMNSPTVYLKKNNTENTGRGVEVCRSAEEYERLVRTMRAEAETYGLDFDLIIQPSIEGENRSFQCLIDPRDPTTVKVITISKQFVEADGKTYAGNENPPITLEMIDTEMRGLIRDMVDRVTRLDPQTFGFMMCDYFATPEGPYAFDPGLRPTGNTATILARMFTEEQTGVTGLSSKFFAVDNATPASFAEFTQPIDGLMGPQAMLKKGVSVLPWGHNQFGGGRLFIGVAKNPADLPDLIADTQTTLNA